jgi:hypothetical protein
MIRNIINNDDDARLQEPVLQFKIPMGTRKNFPQNNRQSEHGLSKRFATPVLGCSKVEHSGSGLTAFFTHLDVCYFLL